MSKQAQDIEDARRVLAAAIGTPQEAAARRNLERVIRRIKESRWSIN